MRAGEGEGWMGDRDCQGSWEGGKEFALERGEDTKEERLSERRQITTMLTHLQANKPFPIPISIPPKT